MTRLLRWSISTALFALFLPASFADDSSFDICVFGATSAGVIAAVQAARSGENVILLADGTHVGGMTSGGLSHTDIGSKAAIGGMAREFYQRMGRHYGTNEVWKLEPSVAEETFRTMLHDARVPVLFNQHLKAVKKKNNRIAAVAMENGRTFAAKMFIDASYEGDLMALAGVHFTVGREDNLQYNETLDGIRTNTPKHQFATNIDPYIVPGDPSSRLLPLIQDVSFGEGGAGDRSIQAYNFRLCLTKNPTNRMPIDPPDNYDPAQYDLLARYLQTLAAAGQTTHLKQLMDIQPMPHDKTDINNNGAFSTDFIGQNYKYPMATRGERERIRHAHEDYTRGLLRFLADDARVPAPIRAEMSEWGLCKDEFTDTAGWPHQLYIREARRMISEYVMTENNCRFSLTAPEPAGLAAYTMDSHNCRRVLRDGHVENEGDVQVGGFPPYQISYRALRPRENECANLLVPVCLSATHIAYGSIRMEPVFMVLGQSCAIAAKMAIEEKAPVQKINAQEFRRRLIAAGQVLQWNTIKRR